MSNKGFASLLLVFLGIGVLSVTAIAGYTYINDPGLLLQLQNTEIHESTPSAVIKEGQGSTESAVIKKDEAPIEGLKNKVVFVSRYYEKFYEYNLETKNRKELFTELNIERAKESTSSAVDAIGSDDGTMLAIVVMKGIDHPPSNLSNFHLSYRSEAYPAVIEYYTAKSNGSGLQKLNQQEVLKPYPDYNQLKISNWNTGENSLLLLASNSANQKGAGKIGFISYDVTSKQSKLLHEVNGLDVHEFNFYNPQTGILYLNVGRRNGEAYIEAINLNTKQQVAKFIYWTGDAITSMFSPYGDYLQMENNQFTARMINLFNMKDQQNPIKRITIFEDGWHVFPLGEWSRSGEYFHLLVQRNDFKAQDIHFYDKGGNFLMKAEAQLITLRRTIYSPGDTKMLLDGISEQSRDHVWRFYEVRTGKEYMPIMESSDLGQPIAWH